MIFRDLFILTSQQGDTNLCTKPLPDAEGWKIVNQLDQAHKNGIRQSLYPRIKSSKLNEWWLDYKNMKTRKLTNLIQEHLSSK